MGDFDAASMRAAFTGPDMDTRCWVSMAVVDAPTADGQTGEGSQTVEFDEDDGQLYVNVMLKPSDVPLRARLGMLTAGAGEAVYFPFVGGEEVVVVIPEGHFRAGAVVVARMNNFYDGFPFESVGGADPKKNATAMIRTRTPLTLESGASVLVHSAAAGAMMQLSALGSVTLRDGAANVLQMSPDVFGFQNKEGDTVLQLDLNAKRFTLAIGQVTMTLSGDAGGTNPQSLLQVPSTLAVGTSGLSVTTAVEHVLTAEAFANLLVQIMNVLSVQIATLGGPLAPLAPLFSLATFPTASMVPGIQAATLSPQTPPVGAALAAAFANVIMVASKANPANVTPGYQTQPGVGCAGFLAG